MSQPVALIAKIHLADVAFKKFLRGSAAQILSECIAQELNQPIGNYTIFRYLKGKQTEQGALFAFFHANHGNVASMQDSRELKVLRQVAAAAGKGSVGWVLMGLDSVNLSPENTVPLFAVLDGVCVTDSLPVIDWPALKKDCDKYFYKEVDTDFALNFSRSRIVDKAIVKQCNVLLEQRRVLNLANHLPTATFFRPLHFFADYYYNGCSLYCQGEHTTLLPEVDAQSFRPAPWGAVDKSYAVVGTVAREVDVASFEMAQKGELCFYKDQHRVFSAALQPLPGADSASFKIKSLVHAEDSLQLYFCGKVWSKADLGDPRILQGAIFHAEHVLQSKRGVYLGTDRLEVDAPTFQLVRTARTASLNVAHVVSDRHGQYLLHRTYDERGRSAGVRLTPATDADAALLALQQSDEVEQRSRVSSFWPSYKSDDNDALADYAGRFSQWASEHYDTTYAEQRHQPDSNFYSAVNNYFYALFKLGRPAEVLDFYPRVAPTAWFNPYLFHHTACCFVALGRLEEALIEVRRAVTFGYELADRMWTDDDLQLLHADVRFQTMAERHLAGGAAASLELLEAIVQLPRPAELPHLQAGGLSRYLGKLACKIQFDEPNDGDPRADLLRKVFKHYLNHRAVDGFMGRDDFYSNYKDHRLLHPLTHFAMFTRLYRTAHDFGYVNVECMDRCLPVLRALQTAVAGAKDHGIQADIARVVQENAFFRHVLTLNL